MLALNTKKSNKSKSGDTLSSSFVYFRISTNVCIYVCILGVDGMSLVSVIVHVDLLLVLYSDRDQY